MALILGQWACCSWCWKGDLDGSLLPRCWAKVLDWMQGLYSIILVSTCHIICGRERWIHYILLLYSYLLFKYDLAKRTMYLEIMTSGSWQKMSWHWDDLDHNAINIFLKPVWGWFNAFRCTIYVAPISLCLLIIYKHSFLQN